MPHFSFDNTIQITIILAMKFKMVSEAGVAADKKNEALQVLGEAAQEEFESATSADELYDITERYKAQLSEAEYNNLNAYAERMGFLFGSSRFSTR
jgi:hypothetical protein